MMTKYGAQNTGSTIQTRARAGSGFLLHVSLAFCILLGMADRAYAIQRGVFPSDAPKSYRAECGECHAAFAPDLLQVEAWQRIMDGLAQHFGVDASVDAKERAEIGSFLARNAGHGLYPMRHGDPLRLTDTLWFHRRHGTVKALFKDPRVMSKANCSACHAHGDEGRYNEFTKLPRKYLQANYPLQ